MAEILMAERDAGRVAADVDWREVARLVLTSREMDRIEEQELVPQKKIFYQFSARGHDLAQVLLGLQLKDGDGAFGYYRSRPLLLAGDASCATGGFWSALTIATTQQLPLLMYVEDNGYGISVPSEYQTPGRDIAANLASFSGLTIFNGDGTEPAEAARLVREAVRHVRTKR